MKVTNVGNMAKLLLAEQFNDYGCAGRGHFDAFGETLGEPIDHADRAFQTWKECTKYASNNDPTKVRPYVYRIQSNSCKKSPGQAFCLCDRKLITTLLAHGNSGLANFPSYLCVTKRPSNGDGQINSIRVLNAMIHM